MAFLKDGETLMGISKTRAKRVSVTACLALSASAVAHAESNKLSPNQPARQENNGVSYWMDNTFASKKVHVLSIDLTNPKISIRASASSERGMTPSDFSRKSGAVAVINGDFFDAAQQTIGLAVGLGETWPKTADTKEWSFLACDDKNDCLIDPYNSVSAVRPAWTSVVGGWQILIDPEFQWSPPNDTECGPFCTTEHPRTAIGLNADRTVMWWIMVEGRQPRLSGLTLSDTAKILKRLGAQWALNLDGGGSSGLIFNGVRMNSRPSAEPQERRVANCLAVVPRP
ncbi:MAG: phosphodiester glycosidase family protein [Proteobacteria bacterium]|nr:phosphodiester glycosidase family protein [Pseudomonadota bacterium]